MRPITRRQFLQAAGASAASLALSQSALFAAEPHPDKRPNILFAIADDWSFPYAGTYGDKVVKTPNFDRVASAGIAFTASYCAAPTCTASRAGVLTGQAIHRLAEGGNLAGFLPSRFRCYPDLLEEAGYVVGMAGKPWSPGSLEGSGRSRNPAGPGFDDFKSFLDQAPKDKPFCFWFGSTNPHRPYEAGTGAKAGMKPEDVVVPGFLPDTPEVRADILDFYYEVQLFDQQLGELLDALDASGKADNTIVVVTSDNGMPFPRSKANIYDIGVHMPLAVRWPAKVKGGRTVSEFVSHCDFAPTFLEAAGLKPLPEMTGRSLLGLMMEGRPLGREAIYFERERHARVRDGDLSYPMRGVRTREFHYIRNPMPDRWPAGDPHRPGNDRLGFGDIDNSPSKRLVTQGKEDKAISRFYRLACEKRPEEELYDLSKDPWQLDNVAGKPEYSTALAKMRGMLDRWMKETGDPRAVDPKDARWDKYEYLGGRKKPAK